MEMTCNVYIVELLSNRVYRVPGAHTVWLQPSIVQLSSHSLNVEHNLSSNVRWKTLNIATCVCNIRVFLFVFCANRAAMCSSISDKPENVFAPPNLVSVGQSDES